MSRISLKKQTRLDASRAALDANAAKKKVAAVRERASYEETVQYAQAAMRRAVNDAQGALSKVIEDLRFDNLRGAMEKLSWLNDPAISVQFGSLAQSVLAIADAEDRSFEDALRYMVETQTRALMRNEYRGGSSHAYHNATDDAKREGAARFAEAGSAWLRELAEARAFETLL